MNKQYPPEFKGDVVALARRGELTKRQIAKDVGISETTCTGGSAESRG